MSPRPVTILITLSLVTSACAMAPVTAPEPGASTPVVESPSPSPGPAKLGRMLDPAVLPALPRVGLAIEVGGALVLVRLDGTVIGHLTGYSVDYGTGGYIPAPGPLLLVGPGKRRAVLDAAHGALTETEGIHIPLAFGAEIIMLGGHEASVERDGVVLAHKRRNDNLNLSQHRDFISIESYVEDSEGSIGVADSRVFDVRTGESRDVPDGCFATDLVNDLLILTCHGLTPKGPASRLLSLAPDGSTRTLVGAGGRGGGHWRFAYASPDGSTLLAQWSGECEVPTAFRVPIQGGEPVTLTGEPLAEAPNSTALGWSPDGRTIAYLPADPGCGSGIPESGIYLVDADGTPELVYGPMPDSWGGAVWTAVEA
jgi:hypothetical protein